MKAEQFPLWKQLKYFVGPCLTVFYWKAVWQWRLFGNSERHHYNSTLYWCKGEYWRKKKEYPK